jgi:hypothetical protein
MFGSIKKYIAKSPYFDNYFLNLFLIFKFILTANFPTILDGICAEGMTRSKGKPCCTTQKRLKKLALACLQVLIIQP